MKNNKGITLIALVVTIIVLLILAGVSIAMLTGQNGILNRASEASYSAKLQDAAETISYAASEAVTNYYNKAYVNSSADGEASALEAIIDAYNTATIDSTVKKDPTTVTYAAATPSYEVKLTYNNNAHFKKGTITKNGIEWKAIDVE